MPNLLLIVNKMQTKLFELVTSEVVYILVMAMGCHLLFLEARDQRLRSHTKHCGLTLKKDFDQTG